MRPARAGRAHIHHPGYMHVPKMMPVPPKDATERLYFLCTVKRYHRGSPGQKGVGWWRAARNRQKNGRNAAEQWCQTGKELAGSGEKTSAGEGGSVTAPAEVREWEAERVARHVAD